MRIRHDKAALQAILLVLCGLTGAAASAETAPRLAPMEGCFVDVPTDLGVALDLDCGYVIVPQSRAVADGPEIRLPYARLNARQPTGAAPLFMLAGGPGQTFTEGPEFFRLFQDGLLGPVLGNRDIVLIEQRGTLRAQPYLDCPGFWRLAREAAEQGNINVDDFAPARDRITACVQRHAAEGVDLAAYNNIENAADVNAIREALGYQRIVYYGESYGTELGQHVMRDFPQILEAVILDGAGALSVTDWSAGRARSAQWGIDNLAELCRQDAECTEQYDIPALLDAAFAQFDEGPIASRFTAPDNPEIAFDLELTAEGFADFLHSFQTSKYGVQIFPALLNAYASEGRDRIAQDMTAQIGAQILADPLAQDANMPLLMHMAMVCSDDPPRSMDAVLVEGYSRYTVLFARSSARLYIEVCDLLNLPELPASADVNVTIDVPVLVLTGGLDTQTPYFISETVVEKLPKATHVIFPSGFHVQVMNVNTCAIQITRDFIADPEGKLDLSCVDEGRPLSFMRPDFTMPETQ